MARKAKQTKSTNHVLLAMVEFGPAAHAEIDLRPMTVFVK